MYNDRVIPIRPNSWTFEPQFVESSIVRFLIPEHLQHLGVVMSIDDRHNEPPTVTPLQTKITGELWFLINLFFFFSF